MANLTQQQLDAIIRRVKGERAVEGMVQADDTWQVYQLSDGTRLSICKSDGSGTIKRQLVPNRWLIVKKF